MPSQKARTIHAARKRFKDVLQGSLSCASETVWVVSETANEGQELLTLAATPVFLRNEGVTALYLDALLRYSFYKESEWRVRTHSYIYSVTDTPELDSWLFGWHWHPDTKPDPHVHVRGNYAKLHLPTGRVSFEKVIQFLIEEVAVTPRRADWNRKLADGHNRHRAFRSWS